MQFSGRFGRAAASTRGHQQIVDLLLKAGADVNAQGGEYGNALQAALHEDHHGIAGMLHEAGAIVIARHADSVDTNAGEADMGGVNAEKSHDSVSPEAALVTVSQDTIATPPKIWFPLRAQRTHTSPRLALLWRGLFFVATGGLILWLVRGRRMASLLLGGI